MAVPKPKSPAPEMSFDRSRGIQNVQKKVGRLGQGGRSANDTSYNQSGGMHKSRYEQYGEAANDSVFEIEDHSIGKKFEDTESIAARALNQKKQQRAPGDAEEEQNQFLIAEEAQQAENEHVQQSAHAALASRAQKASFASKARKLSSFRSWMGIGVVATAWFWIFMCSVISLIGFGTQAFVSATLNETLLGKAVKTVTGIFFDIESLFPGEYLGWAFWGIATLIAWGVFIGYLLYYHLLGVRVFRSTLSSLITWACIGLSMLPVTNLFPWLIIWVVYNNTSSLFSTE